VGARPPHAACTVTAAQHTHVQAAAPRYRPLAAAPYFAASVSARSAT
jgi:hypothetical protein